MLCFYIRYLWVVWLEFLEGGAREVPFMTTNLNVIRKTYSSVVCYSLYYNVNYGLISLSELNKVCLKVSVAFTYNLFRTSCGLLLNNFVQHLHHCNVRSTQTSNCLLLHHAEIYTFQFLNQIEIWLFMSLNTGQASSFAFCNWYTNR